MLHIFSYFQGKGWPSEPNASCNIHLNVNGQTILKNWSVHFFGSFQANLRFKWVFSSQMFHFLMRSWRCKQTNVEVNLHVHLLSSLKKWVGAHFTESPSTQDLGIAYDEDKYLNGVSHFLKSILLEKLLVRKYFNLNLQRCWFSEPFPPARFNSEELTSEIYLR